MNIFNDLRMKIFMTFVIIMILILSPLFYVINMMVGETIEERYSETNTNIAQSTKELVVDYFEGMMHLMKVAAKTKELSNLDTEKCSMVLQFIVDDHLGIDQMYIMDSSGMQIYKTSFEETMGDRSDRVYFQKAIKGENYISDMIISRSTNQPIVTIAVPIYDKEKIVGVLGASVNLSEINNVVNSNRVLENGYTYIVDNYGRLIIHPNSDYVREMLNIDYLEPVQRVLNGETGKGKYIFEGVEKMVSFTPYEFAGWGVLSQVPVDEAYQDIKQMKTVLIISFLLLLTLTILLSYLATGVHMRPLKEISEKIKATGKGNYKIQFDGFKKDQIGIIQKSLVDLSNEISVYHNDLEDLVKNRTIELLEAKSSLESNLIELEMTQKKLVETEKISALGRLGITLSHELNTPLGTSVTQLSYLTRYLNKIEDGVNTGKIKKSELHEFIKDSREMIDSVNESISRAINTLKSFSKITSIKSYEDLSYINIHDEIMVSANDIKSLYNEITIDLNCDSDYQIKSYSGGIGSIINHLLLDSIHHSGLEMKSLKIQINVEERVNDVVITYSDNGKGVEDEIAENIFEPLFKGSLSYDTTGLGLSLLYTIISNIMGGTIELDREYSGGAKFNIVFPKE